MPRLRPAGRHLRTAVRQRGRVRQAGTCLAWRALGHVVQRLALARVVRAWQKRKRRGRALVEAEAPKQQEQQRAHFHLADGDGIMPGSLEAEVAAQLASHPGLAAAGPGQWLQLCRAVRPQFVRRKAAAAREHAKHGGQAAPSKPMSQPWSPRVMLPLPIAPPTHSDSPTLPSAGSQPPPPTSGHPEPPPLLLCLQPRGQQGRWVRGACCGTGRGAEGQTMQALAPSATWQPTGGSGMCSRTALF